MISLPLSTTGPGSLSVSSDFSYQQRKGSLIRRITKVMLQLLFVFGYVFAVTGAFSMTAAAKNVVTSPSIKECGCVIVGGGPSGLACAISLAQRGYKDIHILERNPSANYFEVDKAYLYRIDGRGQRLTDQLGITEKLEEVGCQTHEFLNITIVEPDSNVRVVAAPADPSQKTAYWLPRRALIRFLVDRIAESYGKEVTFHWNVTIDSLIMPESVDDPAQLARVRAFQGDGKLINFVSTRVIGCDGMNSRIRSGLKEWATFSGKTREEKNRFSLHYVDSPSAGLKYKILTLESGFPLTANSSTITDPMTCYSFVGRQHGRFIPPLRLGCLPYKMKVPRTANIIARPDAEIFSLKTGPEVLEFLARELPQCSIDRMISREEADRFAASQGGYFPKPQYALEVQQVLAGGQGGVVLLGDAIHAFPPDLGAGVNSAFEDVLDLIYAFDRSNGLWGKALPQYEKSRAPQSQSICRLIPIGFPHQYNHLPIRKTIKLMGVAARAGLNKIAPWLIAPPVFFMVQDPRLDYAVVYKKAMRTTRILQATGAALTVLVWQKTGLKSLVAAAWMTVLQKFRSYKAPSSM